MQENQIKEKLKNWAHWIENFVDNNLAEKHQREENIRKLSLLFETQVKDVLLSKGMRFVQNINSVMSQSVSVRVKKWPHFKGTLPRYQTELASGMDVRAQLEAPIEVGAGQRVLVPTGLSFAIPAGYEIQVRPRSGWALRDGITLLNTPGTIDADYRGEVKIIIINLGENAVTINDQDRIAQLVLAPVVKMELTEVENLEETERASGGFGSTGRS